MGVGQVTAWPKRAGRHCGGQHKLCTSPDRHPSSPSTLFVALHRLPQLGLRLPQLLRRLRLPLLGGSDGLAQLCALPAQAGMHLLGLQGWLKQGQPQKDCAQECRHRLLPS